MEQPFKYRIVVEWSDEDEAFLGRVPALAGVVSQPLAHGDTMEDAIGNTLHAALLALETLREEKRPIPPEDAGQIYSGKLNLRLPQDLHRDLAELADVNSMSLNQFLLSLLAKGVGGEAKGGRTKPASKRYLKTEKRK